MTLIHSFDLDSTLADTRHRQHMVDAVDRTKTDWIAYALACAGDGDGPAAPVLNALITSQGALRSLLSGLRVGAIYDEDAWFTRDMLPIDFIVVSRRHDAARGLTAAWLNARGWAPKALLMLGDEHSNPAIRTQPEWKVDALVRYMRRSGDQVVCHYDDNAAVTEALTERGIPAVTVCGAGSEATIGLEQSA